MQLRLCVLGAWMNLQPLVWVSLSRSLVVEKQAAALLKAARYPTLINMHGQTANQTLVVSCWGREVENVEKEGREGKAQKYTQLLSKIRMDDVRRSLTFLVLISAGKLGGVKKNATMTVIKTEPGHVKSFSSLTGQ